MLFFVLSGFVLVLSLTREPLNVRVAISFYLRRSFRIYPALWLAVIFSGLVTYFVSYFAEAPRTSSWFLAVFSPDLTPLDFAKSATGFGTKVLPPLWTIRVELIASILLPILAWWAMRGRFYIAGVAALMLIMTLAIADLHHHAVNYMVDFAIGAAIVPWIPYEKFTHSRSDDRVIALFALGILVFFRIFDPSWRFESNYEGVVPDLVEALSAGVLVAIAAIRPESLSILKLPQLIFIGDISYSIYLLHFPIVVLVGKLMGIAMPDFIDAHQDIAAVFLSTMTILLVIPLSALTYQWIELPSIAFGKRLLRSI